MILINRENIYFFLVLQKLQGGEGSCISPVHGKEIAGLSLGCVAFFDYHSTRNTLSRICCHFS